MRDEVVGPRGVRLDRTAGGKRGLLTPSIFTGMHEVHSQREWVTLQDMEKSTEVLLKIAELWVGGE